MDERDKLGALLRAEESYREARLIRRDGEKELAAGYRLLARAVTCEEVGVGPTRQSALLTNEGYMKLAKGHDMLGHSDEIIADVHKVHIEAMASIIAESPCGTCDGTKKVLSRSPYQTEASEIPCPDCVKELAP